MSLREHPPRSGTEIERMGKHLKHGVTLLRSITSVSQRYERVRGVVREIEATLQRQLRLNGVTEPSLS
jgi:hypothetical protein